MIILKKTLSIALMLCLVLSMTACDMDDVMSVVDTSNQRVELVVKGEKTVKDTINSKEQFTLDFANITEVEDCIEREGTINKVTDVTMKENAEKLVRDFIKFISTDYKTVDDISALDEYLCKDITDTELRMFDWWGKNINQVSETWYLDTIVDSNDFYVINTISRIKREIDGTEKDVDVAAKWKVVHEDGHLKIGEASVVSLDEVKESITNILSAESDIAIYKPTKSQGNEYKDIKSFDKDAIDSMKEVYKNSVVAVLTDNNEGTGLIIETGYVMTTYDNIYKARGVKIVFSDDTEKDIDGIVYANKEHNLVVLKLNEKVGTPIELGNYDELKDGDMAAVVGCAATFVEHITAGNITNLTKNEYDTRGMLMRAPVTNDCLGSAVVNSEGKVVGIITYANSTFKEMSKAIGSNKIQEIKEKCTKGEWDKTDGISFSNMKWNSLEAEKDEKKEESIKTIE